MVTIPPTTTTGIGGSSSTMSNTGAGGTMSGAAGEAGAASTASGGSAGTPGVGEAAVVFVLDRSTSARENFSDGLSRWEAIQDALTREGGPIAQNADRLALGVLDYTGFAGGTCPAFGDGLEPATDNYAEFVSYISDLTLPGEDKSEAPTRQAIEEAVAMLQGRTEPKAIVLVSDGATDDDCSGDFDDPACESQALYAAQQAYAAGVRTYMLGVTEISHDYMQSMANAGSGEPVQELTGGGSCGPEAEQPTTAEQGGEAPYRVANSLAELAEEDLPAILDLILEQ